MTKKSDGEAHLFQITFFSRPKSELLNILQDYLKHSRKTAYITTPNPEQVIQSRTNREFLKQLQQSDFNLPDGVGIVLASRILSFRSGVKSLPQRLSGRAVVADLLQLAWQQQLKVLVLGGRGYDSRLDPVFKCIPANNQQPNFDSALKIIISSDRKLAPVYWHYGYRDIKRPTFQEETKVSQIITQLKPDIVFVAFGAVWQEKWMFDHQVLLNDQSVKIAMAVGGSFDYIWGTVPRVPKLLTQLGLEWLFRLVTQPWRWKRQLRLIQFLGLVIQEFFKKPK